MALDSLFRIYSMSKPITGVAMMQLYEQGKWQLDDPITKYAPELAGLKELTWDKDGKLVTVLATPKKPATMRQLMNHTAGFGYGLGVHRARADSGTQRQDVESPGAGRRSPARSQRRGDGRVPVVSRVGRHCVRTIDARRSSSGSVTARISA
jgi:CubicO group peptidase (beta-lactamase class C family)